MTELNPAEIGPDDEVVIAAMPAAWYSPAASGRTGNCKECGVAVSLSPTSVAFIDALPEGKAQYLCIPCMKAQIESGEIDQDQLEMHTVPGQQEELAQFTGDPDFLSKALQAYKTMPPREWAIEYWKENAETTERFRTFIEELAKNQTEGP